jgi:pyruvate, water dikinase
VDVEFTANLLSDGRWRIDPVQCRPLQVKEGGVHVPPPEGLRDEDIVLATRGPVIGQSSIAAIDRLIIVDPDRYAALPIPMRYEVARAIGRLVHLPADPAPVLMLVGPGRWGTSTPSLGVPVSFGEISAVSVICEVVAMGGGVVPDVSLGSHFFNDLVEADMLYLALFPGRAGDVILPSVPGGSANRLGALLPDDAELSDVIRVTDFPLADGRMLYVNADSLRQRAVSYLSPCTP